MSVNQNEESAGPGFPKCPTGIPGLDEITGGGFPRGRTTLVCGRAGRGKTLLGMEFLVRGATAFGEPGVFLAFEETCDELTQNVATLGFDLKSLAAQKLIALDHARVEDEIIAIPTLLRRLPTPLRKVIGDISDSERTLVGLQLRPLHL
jgi:circadian clock protein KaiC